MNYKFKDLIITVIPNHLKPIAACDSGSSVCTGRCSNADSDCPGGCSNGDTKFCGTATSAKQGDWWEYVIDPIEIIEMKATLQYLANKLDRATGGTKDVRDLSKGELESLEEKLSSALRSLKNKE